MGKACLIKKGTRIAGTVIILLLILAGIQRLLMPKYRGDIIEGGMIEEYYAQEMDHDVIFIGDCEVYTNFSPLVLWEEYGINSYIRGSAEQLIWQSYYLLEETLAYEKPKVVVFNVLSMMFDKPQRESYNRMTLDGMRWSLSKVRSIQASMTEEEHFIEYVFPILRYHNRWNQLTDEDFRYLWKKGIATFNGYYMRVDVRPAEDVPEGRPLGDYRFGENAYVYLDKMTRLCEENGVELVLIKAPSLYPYWYEQWEEQIVDYAGEHQLKYYNFLKVTEEIGLNYNEDTYDAGLHLNLSGAEKLTRYFGEILARECGLENRGGEVLLSQYWQREKEEYQEEIARQKKNRERINMLSNEKKVCLVALLVGLAVSICGCGESSNAYVDSGQVENIVSQSQEGSTMDFSNANQVDSTDMTEGYSFLINGVRVSVDMDMDELVLGESKSVFNAPSCAGEGISYLYNYNSFEIETYPAKDGKNRIGYIFLKDDTVATAEGIDLSMKKEDVLYVYGDDYEEVGSMITYEREKTKLSFVFEGENIISIEYASSVLR